MQKPSTPAKTASNLKASAGGFGRDGAGERGLPPARIGCGKNGQAAEATGISERQWGRAWNLPLAKDTNRRGDCGRGWKPLRGPRTVAENLFGRKKFRARIAVFAVTASMDARISSSCEEAPEIELLAGKIDMRELVDSSESMSEPLR